MNLQLIAALTLLASSAVAAPMVSPVRGVGLPVAGMSAVSAAGAVRMAPSAMTAAPLAAHASLAAAPAAASALNAAPAAAPASPESALVSLEKVAAPIAENAGLVQQLGLNNQRFDGSNAMPVNDGLPFAAPNQHESWYDNQTGAYETQATKIKKALQLAMSNPLASAIKNALPQNTLYRVDNSWNWTLPAAVRSMGDDAEKAHENTPLIVFHQNALKQFSPELLAAKMAGMWARHMYREKIPASAEKTYVEHSVAIRVFMALTGSTASWWNGNKDYQTGSNWRGEKFFEMYNHYFFWVQGRNYPNVRQGPFFKEKIMQNSGTPVIDADARGRKTLFQRANAGEISNAAAEQAQQSFDGFVSNETR